MGDFSGELLAGEANEIGTGYHGDVSQDKDGHMPLMAGIFDCDGGWYDRPQDADDHGDAAGGAEGNAEEVKRMDATSATLTGGLDVWCKLRVAVRIGILVDVRGQSWLPRAGLLGQHKAVVPGTGRGRW